MSRTALIFIVSILCACVRTELTSPGLHPRVERLLSNTQGIPITLFVKNNSRGSAGHQYLFFMIPFGTIFHETVGTQLSEDLLTNLVLAGFAPKLAAEPLPTEFSGPALLVTLNEFQVSAYDLFFTRRIFCKVNLEGTLIAGNGEAVRTENALAELSDYQSYAFEKELQHIFGKTLERGSLALLKNLGLAPSNHQTTLQ